MAPVIDCRRLWKVYGRGADAVLAGAIGQLLPTEAVAERLSGAGHVIAAADVSFAVEQGEIFVIMGLSGSGKSTVLRCLSRLIEPSAGEVLLEGRNLRQLTERQLIELRRHKLGMVFQHFGLLP